MASMGGQGKVYDTVHYVQEVTDPYAGVPKDVLKMAQYKILARRLAQIKLWKKQFALLSLPRKATIIDVKGFSTAHGPRTIIAWMTDIAIHVDQDDMYTCPEVTMGKGYFNGRLHYSLINTGKKKIINSIKIDDLNPFEEGDTIRYYESDEFLNYPFAIANPRYRNTIGQLIYYTIGGTDSTEGEADILHFTDFNADGKKLELCLFNQGSCVGKNSTLISYDEKGDSIKWISWDITWKNTAVNGKDSVYTTTEHWINEAMTSSFDKEGKLSYEFDYRGRGGSFMRYYLNYDKSKDKYSGIIDSRELPEDSTIQQSWLPEGRKLEH